jgi:hypothetical protein
MKIFGALKKLITYLVEENNDVKYDQPSVQEEIEKKIIDDEESIIHNPYVSQVRDWVVNKIDLLDNSGNARALASEFDEWINIPEGNSEIDYLYIEDDSWTEDQEIDVR